jgi:hypothetical protein
LFGGEVSFDPTMAATATEACPPDERLLKK